MKKLTKTQQNSTNQYYKNNAHKQQTIAINKHKFKTRPKQNKHKRIQKYKNDKVHQ